MPYGPANDIIQQARNCHHVVAEFYQQLNEKAKAAHVKMLLDYLARHEANLSKTLDDYEHDVRSKALQEWHRLATEENVLKKLNLDDYSEEMSIDDILKLVETIDACFISTYQGVLDTTTNDKVRDIFENLLQMARQGRLTMSRIVLELSSM